MVIKRTFKVPLYSSHTEFSLKRNRNRFSSYPFYSVKKVMGEGRGVLIREEHLFVILAKGVGTYLGEAEPSSAVINY